MNSMWTKDHPDPPPKKPSDWYWFIFKGEEEECVIEVYPERKHWPEGLWGPRIERIKVRKNKRGRPRKEDQ